MDTTRMATAEVRGFDQGREGAALELAAMREADATQELAAVGFASRAHHSEQHPHKRLQAFARQLVEASQLNAMKPAELRRLVGEVAGHLQDVAIDVAFLAPRKTD